MGADPSVCKIETPVEVTFDPRHHSFYVDPPFGTAGLRWAVPCPVITKMEAEAEWAGPFPAFLAILNGDFTSFNPLPHKSL